MFPERPGQKPGGAPPAGRPPMNGAPMGGPPMPSMPPMGAPSQSRAMSLLEQLREELKRLEEAVGQAPM